MQARMQKTWSQGNDCPQRDRTESEGYEGVQTYIWMTEDNVVEVPKVNKEKTVVSYVRGVKYLGYSYYINKGKCLLTVHPKAKAKMRRHLKELTGRSNGMGYAKRKENLRLYIKGWVNYYHLATMKRLTEETDEWLRRRLRMCIWKSWKLPQTRIKNLIKCGINKYNARRWGYVKGYWRVASSPIMHTAASNMSLRKAGYICLSDSMPNGYPNEEPPYAEPHVQWCERSVNTKVGDKHL